MEESRTQNALSTTKCITKTSRGCLVTLLFFFFFSYTKETVDDYIKKGIFEENKVYFDKDIFFLI
jgi:hypothetical protein